jgi:hypothetical protein
VFQEARARIRYAVKPRTFTSADASVIRLMGDDFIFLPAIIDAEYSVKMVIDEEAQPGYSGGPIPLMVLFGTLNDSGFTDLGAPPPLRNDRIRIDDMVYRIYEVKWDDAGGTEGRAGLWLYLTEYEDS